MGKILSAAAGIVGCDVSSEGFRMYSAFLDGLEF